MSDTHIRFWVDDLELNTLGTGQTHLIWTSIYNFSVSQKKIHVFDDIDIDSAITRLKFYSFEDLDDLILTETLLLMIFGVSGIYFSG